MDDLQFEQFKQQSMAQQKAMDEMMKKMGFGDFQGKGLSDKDLLAELGGPSGNDHKGSEIDELMKKFGQDQPMGDDFDDDELLNELEQDSNMNPLQIATEMKSQIDQMKAQAKDLVQSGKKEEAVLKLREFKEKQQQLDQFLKDNPDIKPEQLSQPVKQIEQEKSVGSSEKQLTNDEILEIYEKYHDPECIQSMTVIEYEIERCQNLTKQLKNQDLINALNDRIDILKYKKESIESDIQNEFLTMEQYVKSVQEYYKVEKLNLKNAQKNNIGNENIQLIKERIQKIEQEMKEANDGMNGQQEQAKEIQPKEQQITEKIKEPKTQQNQSDYQSVQKQSVILKQVKFDQEIYDSLEQRKIKYSNAATYCMKVLGNKQVAMKMLEAAENLKQVSTDYKLSGIVQQDKLNPSLTPQILFQMTNEERQAKFDELIQDYQTQTTQLKEKAKKCIDGSKQAKQLQSQNDLRDMAKKYIDQVKDLDLQIKDLESGRENKWCPPPKVKQVSSQIKKAKIYDQIDENQFEIEVTKSDTLASSSYIYVKVKMLKDTEKVLQLYFDRFNEDYTQKVIIPEAFQKSLKNQKLIIAVKQRAFIVCKKVVYQNELSLRGLIEQNEIMKNFKHNNVTFQVKVRIRQAYSKNETVVEDIKNNHLEQIFISFDEYLSQNQQQTIQIPQKPIIQEENKKQPPVQKTQNQPIIQKAQKQENQIVEKQNNQTQNNQIQSKPDIGNLSQSDISDPENLTLLRSVAYCTSRLAEVTKEIQNSINTGVRVNPKIRELNKNLCTTKMQLEQGCGQGAISPEDYIAILEDLQKKDQELAKYFNSLKNDNPQCAINLKICMNRFKIVKQELQEIKSQM